MKKFLKTIIGFLLLALLLAFPMDYYLTHYHFNDWDNVSSYQKDFWLLKQRDKDINIGVIGTSRAFHVINPAVIKEISPTTKMVNYGTDGTSHGDHYLYLYELLRKGVKMDTLLIEVDEFTLSGWLTNTVPFKDYVFALKFNEEPFKQAYRDYFDRRKYFVWKVPLLRYIEYNSHYQLNPWNNNNEDRFTHRFGFAEAFSKGFRRDFKKDSLELRIHPFDIKYLNMSIELAQKNHIEVILFTAPVEESFISIEINRKRSFDKIKDIAKKHGVPYYDFSVVEGLRDTSFFSDETHLNGKGADKFTKHFYRKLNEK